MAEIFLSYRRQDSQSATGRLADDLEARFGDERVFRDHEIAAGDDFVDAIRRSVESATVVLVVVGPHWLAAADPQGRRRLDDPGDFVRLEIELALAAGVAVVPVLVEGARMPSQAELPSSLAAFARCQAVELADRRWRFDVDTLIASLQARFGIDTAPSALSDAGAASSRSVRWVGDLADLTLHPRRLIARRQSDSASDHARAFAFLCGAIVAGQAILLTAIDIDLVARGSTVDIVLGVLAWLFTGLLLGLVLAALLVGALALAWRIVARGAVVRRTAVVGAYVYGGAWLGAWLGITFSVVAVQLVDPSWLSDSVADAHAAVTTSAPIAPRPMHGFDHGPLGDGARVLLVVGGLVLVATLAWCIAAWGAFRQSLAASRLQSWLATTLWIMIVAALVWLPTLL
jgi:hypothetical protein